MQELLQNALTLLFVVSSMFGMGLSLKLRDLIGALRGGRAVLLALVANFVVVPGVAWLLAGVIGDLSVQIGLILIGSCAGSAFLIKLAQLARADPADAVALLVLLVVGTVIYLPLALPLLLRGIEVDSWAIGARLGAEILLPLVLGLLAHRYLTATADAVAPFVGHVANVSLVFLLLLMVFGNLGALVALASGPAIVCTLLLVGAAAATGWLLGPSPSRRATLALGTGQRNIAVAFLIANSTFHSREEVFVFLAAAAVLDLSLCLVLAHAFGWRRRAAEPPWPEVPA